MEASPAGGSEAIGLRARLYHCACDGKDRARGAEREGRERGEKHGGSELVVHARSSRANRCVVGPARRRALRLSGLHYRWHDLRHTYISRLAGSPTASQATIRSLAGHVSKRMLDRYSHIRNEANVAAVASLEPDVVPVPAEGRYTTGHSQRPRRRRCRTRPSQLRGMRSGQGVNRTPDTQIFSLLLCQLSYLARSVDLPRLTDPPFGVNARHGTRDRQRSSRSAACSTQSIISISSRVPESSVISWRPVGLVTLISVK
jgi:hypothetical protein